VSRRISDEPIKIKKETYAPVVHVIAVAIQALLMWEVYGVAENPGLCGRRASRGGRAEGDPPTNRKG